MRSLRLITKLIIILNITVLPAYSQKSLYTPLEFQEAYKKQTRSPDGSPGQNYWQNHAAYDIQVEIIPAKNLLKGKEEIIYSNLSPDTLGSITFQLHQDMYKKGNARDVGIDPSDITSGTLLHNFSIDNRDIDLNRNERVKRDNALLKVDLKDPVPPGAKISFTFEWEFHIPEKTMIRFGKTDSLSYFIAYWYPRVAVYDDLFGWDDLGYDGNHEFNNDYSNYKVKIKVPGDYLVWSTGELLNPEAVLPGEVREKLKLCASGSEQQRIMVAADYDRNRERAKHLSWIFTSENETDFAFALSNHYIWDAIPAKAEDDSKVLVNVVYHPDASDHMKGMAAFLKASIEHFSWRTPEIPYPYKDYTVFVGNVSLTGSGMEFPAMANNQFYPDDLTNKALFAHELAHNYLPFMVNINQAQFAWMDEGITTYLEYEILRYMLKEERFDVWEKTHPLELLSGRFNDVPVFNPSIFVHPSANDLLTNYYRPAFALVYLEDVLGKEKFNACLKEFILRWKGKRPIPHDLFNTFNHVCGENLDWFWQPWFFDFAYPDLSIEEVTDQVATITNPGNLPIPVYLRITYIDDTVEEISRTARVWSGGKHQLKIKLKNDQGVKMVELNDLYFTPDIDRKNNLYMKMN